MVDPIDRKLSTSPVKQEDVVDFINRELVPVVEKLRLALAALLARVLEGEGSPEGVVEADIAAVYLRQDGTPGTLVYVKTTDDSSSGWLAVL